MFSRIHLLLPAECLSGISCSSAGEWILPALNQFSFRESLMIFELLQHFTIHSITQQSIPWLYCAELTSLSLSETAFSKFYLMSLSCYIGRGMGPSPAHSWFYRSWYLSLTFHLLYLELFCPLQHSVNCTWRQVHGSPHSTLRPKNSFIWFPHCHKNSLALQRLRWGRVLWKCYILPLQFTGCSSLHSQFSNSTIFHSFVLCCFGITNHTSCKLITEVPSKGSVSIQS